MEASQRPDGTPPLPELWDFSPIIYRLDRPLPEDWSGNAIIMGQPRLELAQIGRLAAWVEKLPDHGLVLFQEGNVSSYFSRHEMLELCHRPKIDELLTHLFNEYDRMEPTDRIGLIGNFIRMQLYEAPLVETITNDEDG